MLPFRGIMPFRDMPMNMSRGNFPNRFGRFNNIRNMAAGDSFLQTPFYFQTREGDDAAQEVLEFLFPSSLVCLNIRFFLFSHGLSCESWPEKCTEEPLKFSAHLIHKTYSEHLPGFPLRSPLCYFDFSNQFFVHVFDYAFFSVRVEIFELLFFHEVFFKQAETQFDFNRFFYCHIKDCFILFKAIFYTEFSTYLYESISNFIIISINYINNKNIYLELFYT